MGEIPERTHSTYEQKSRSWRSPWGFKCAGEAARRTAFLKETVELGAREALSGFSSTWAGQCRRCSCNWPGKVIRWRRSVASCGVSRRLRFRPAAQVLRSLMPTFPRDFRPGWQLFHDGSLSSEPAKRPVEHQEIALKLNISYATVKRHTINLYGKLGVNQRWKAVARAEELNLLSPRRTGACTEPFEAGST